LRAPLYAPAWSPDGETHGLLRQARQALGARRRAAVQLQEVADDPRGQIIDYAWSPGGGHLAFAWQIPSGPRSTSGAPPTARAQGHGRPEQRVVPSWDPEGKYLFYLSERTFAPQISSQHRVELRRQPQTGIFALALRKDVPHPFPPESDEVNRRRR
jgi:tricorn protease